MNGLPYYKAYPRDFIEGTVGMSFELKGAYRLVLDLIYMQGGELPDDAGYIAGLLGCTVKKWNVLRAKLIELGKLTVTGEFLTNFRAVSEIETLGKLRDKQRENRSRPNKNNGIPSPRCNHTEPDTEPESEGSKQRSAEPPRDAAAALPSISDLKSLSDRLHAVVGECLANQAIAPGLASMMVPQMWLDQGCDLERDIVPTLQIFVARGKRNISTWDYFTKPITETKIKRLAGLPDVKVVPFRSTPELDQTSRIFAKLKAEAAHAAG